MTTPLEQAIAYLTSSLPTWSRDTTDPDMYPEGSVLLANPSSGQIVVTPTHMKALVHKGGKLTTSYLSCLNENPRVEDTVQATLHRAWPEWATPGRRGDLTRAEQCFPTEWKIQVGGLSRRSPNGLLTLYRFEYPAGPKYRVFCHHNDKTLLGTGASVAEAICDLAASLGSQWDGPKPLTDAEIDALGEAP